MDWSRLFSLANGIALPAWLLLMVAPNTRAARFVARTLVPSVLALGYSVLMLVYLARGGGGFGSLAAVQELLSTEPVLLAGWLHYLAFDLFVGAWIVERAETIALPRFALVPILGATFLLGPLGYLLFRVSAALLSRVRSAPGAPA